MFTTRVALTGFQTIQPCIFIFVVCRADSMYGKYMGINMSCGQILCLSFDSLFMDNGRKAITNFHLDRCSKQTE